MKIKYYLLITFVFGITKFTFSQENNTTESIFFNNFKKDSINYDFVKGMCLIDTTFSIDNYLNNKEKLDDFIKNLPKKENSDKKEKKRIKKIYDTVHKKYFEKYEADAFFNEIFTSGNYNCVSATALYTYIFSELKIPYNIKELPSHVFLIAYPNKYKIHLETTVPGVYGFYVPEKKEIKRIVDELVLIKLITKNEVSKKGYDVVYQEYFYGKEQINKSDLIGMQYYNKSIFEYNNKNFEEALVNIKKSFTFYKNPYSKAVLKDIIIEIINNTSLDNKKIITKLFSAIQLLKYKKEIDKLTIDIALEKIVLNDKNDLNFIESLLDDFNTLENTELKNACLLRINKYLANKHLNKRNSDKAIRFIKQILLANPNNKEAKEMITFAIYDKISTMPIIEDNISIIESYYSEYEFLFNDKKTISQYAAFYGKLAQTNYRFRDEKKGKLFFEKFEQTISKNKDLMLLNPELVANLYLLVGRFYYGTSDFINAKNIFEKGLVYYPKHPELEKMLKWAIEDMN